MAVLPHPGLSLCAPAPPQGTPPWPGVEGEHLPGGTWVSLREVEGEINSSAVEPSAKGGSALRPREGAGPRQPLPSICNLIDIWRQEANQYKSIDVPR